jgi:putative alpha-1,2-mannosidase
VSEDGAVCALQQELPDWDFDGVRARAEALWAADLGKVEISDDNEKAKRIFYTAMCVALRLGSPRGRLNKRFVKNTELTTST